MIEKIHKLKKVEILWVDASYLESWCESEATNTLSLISVSTVGYLVKKDDELIVVCGSWIYDGSSTVYKDVQIIPRFDVKKITELTGVLE